MLGICLELEFRLHGLHGCKSLGLPWSNNPVLAYDRHGRWKCNKRRTQFIVRPSMDIKANAKKHAERYGSKKKVEQLSGTNSEPSQQSVEPS